ncbi:unnamed protein product [Rotaria sp. Silwood2]|nr:unnamed protein product [Rotaria sp. Silwood2]
MQEAQADIDREMQKAEAEGASEEEKAKRINNIFASKNMRAKQMHNSFGATSSLAQDCYSKCVDMNEMKSVISSKLPTPPAAFASAMPTAETTYDLMEDQHVSEEQSSRVYQKWQNRRK